MVPRLDRVVLSSALVAIALFPLASNSIAAPVSPTSASKTTHRNSANLDFNGYDIAVYSPDLVLGGGGGSAFGKAAADSFYIYGGPDAPDRYGDAGEQPDGWIDGKFQNQLLQPAVQQGTAYPSDGWFGKDLTENIPFWQLSNFNSPTGTQAAWSGQSEAQEPGWVSGAGYGNNWNDQLDYRLRVLDAGAPTTLSWNFVYNHDTEPIYDFFRAQYDSAGVMVDLLAVDESNKDSLGIFSPVQATLSVTIEPSSYVGAGADEIHLRFRVDSDGGWSDEDGLWPTEGAAQVDDVTVDPGPNGMATFDDFNAGFGNWTPTPSIFAGDFAKVFPQIGDIDPCADNLTPQVAFIDDGTPPFNGNGASTGGTISAAYGYGVPGGYVVNHTGGLSGGRSAVNNVVRSPAINFDLPGTADDAANGVLLVNFDRWTHLPLGNAIYYMWSVRSTTDVPGPDENPTFDLTDWTGWRNNSFVYYGGGVGIYGRTSVNVANKIPDFSSVTYVQIELGVVDLADLFGFPGIDATPSPTFDNVSLQKAAAAGPAFNARTIDLFQDSFPTSGATIDQYDGPAGPFDELQFATRSDRASAINGAGMIALAGDSITVDVVPVVPGTALTGNPVLKYRIFANPAFDHVRDVAVYGNPVANFPNYSVFDGTIPGDSTRTSTGVAIQDRFTFDMPFDGPFDRKLALIDDPVEPAGFFPGDWIAYYIEASDSDGNTTTIPPGPGGGAPPTGWPVPEVGQSKGELSEKGGGICPTWYPGYPLSWYYSAMPTIWVDIAAGPEPGKGLTTEAPNILVWRDVGTVYGELDYLYEVALGQLGLSWKRDYDRFMTWGPTSGVDNGLGSECVHGATAEQLAAYDCILYFGGNLSSILISDGTGANGEVDRSNDQGVLAAWKNQPGDRYSAYFGDHLASYLNTNGVNFLQNVLAVDLGPGGSNVSPLIGNQTAPRVLPDPTAVNTAGVFGSSFLAFGGCPNLNQFDDIRPLAGSTAERAHQFGPPGSNFAPSASVWHQRSSAGFNKVDVTFPYGFRFIQGPAIGPGLPDGRSARSVLLGELLEGFGKLLDPLSATDTPAAEGKLSLSQNTPNPFNPTTEISFDAPVQAHARLTVFDLRGRVVRTLLNESVDKGVHQIRFDGRDDAGAPLASGVYLYRLEGFDETLTRKMMLVK